MGDKFVGWAALTQLVTEIKTRIASRIAASEKGASNGVATLDATGRVPYAQLPESAMEFKGSWNASTNNPELKDGIGTNGDFYVCNVAGTVNFGTAGSPRNVTFYANDRALYDGNNAQWIRLPAGEVRSVNGMSGDVVLSIPAAQVNSDWNASSGKAQILNKPSLATVATSGSYNDLSNKPTMPTVTDTIAEGNSNAVSSNAVFNALNIPVAASATFTAKSGFNNQQNILSAVYDDGVNPPILYFVTSSYTNEIYKTTNADWTTFTKAADFTISVHSLSIIGSTILLGTSSYGLYYVNINSTSTYHAYGTDNFSDQTVNSVALFNNKYYAATDNGLYGPANSVSGTFSRLSYFSQMGISDLVVFNNNLYIASGKSGDKGPLTRTSDGVNFTSLRDNIGNPAMVTGLCVYNNALYVASYAGIHKTTDGNTFTQIYSGTVSGKLYLANDTIYFYYNATGAVVTIKNDTVIANSGLLTNTTITSVAYNRSSSLTFVTFKSDTAGQYYVNSIDYTPSQFVQQLVNYLKTIFVQVT